MHLVTGPVAAAYGDEGTASPRGPSPSQLQVVRCQAQRAVVLGGAGTGKTTCALWAVEAALEKASTDPWRRVLLLTFSRTAVAQIWERLWYSHLSRSLIRERLEIATFHGFAYHIVRDFGGNDQLRVRSAAEVQLLGSKGATLGLSYGDLVPAALTIVRRPSVRRLLVKRWALIICDEFQDTSDDQWELLLQLSESTRLLMLADPNQMIYEDLPGTKGVGPHRLRTVLGTAEVFELQADSFRDPTNILPSAAERIQARDFEATAVRSAVESGRFSVIYYNDDGTESRCAAVTDAARGLARRGNLSLGVFLHGNNPAAELSAALGESGVTHVLLGVGEAQQEALVAMAYIAAFGAGWSDRAAYLERLAVFATACRRGKMPVEVARQLAGLAPLPAELERRISALENALHESTDVDEIVKLATSFWSDIGVNLGQRPWLAAAGSFLGLTKAALRHERPGKTDFEELIERATLTKSEALAGSTEETTSPLRLMNFHQTKGREADATILLFGNSDYFGQEQEPFRRLSRLIYVALTRARREVVILLPDSPHPVVAPLMKYALKI